MFEGLRSGSLSCSTNEYLYRGTKMARKEIDEIMKIYERWNQKQDKNSLPCFLLHSRTFLSFSKIENKILRFLGSTDNKYYGVVFKLRNDVNIDDKYATNADLENISRYPAEKEVLFFPQTTFCLKNITKDNYNGRKDIIIITLDYLGK